jgi:hypothetical protein
MSPWEKLLERPHAGGHFVQLYEADDSGLVTNVGHYLWEGLKRGEGVLAIVEPFHRTLLLRCLDRLGADLGTLLGAHQLVFWDAQETLARFMVAGQPDWRLFENTICAAMRQVRPADGCEGLRAYGEMVGILWKVRQFPAAIRLEQLWNKLLEQSSFSLYCAYAIDIFGAEFEVADLESVLCTHTHLIPAESDGMLETAIHRSLDEILGPHADALRVLIKANYRASWAVMPGAENMVLWLRKNLPEKADRILSLARQHYRFQFEAANAVHKIGVPALLPTVPGL